jgi:GNAT superfamily N-acetyltransferase
MTPRQPSQDHGDPILHDLTIVPFRPENQTEVKRLILSGLTEHWGQLDPTQNPDLNDIGATYAQATFLVAWWHGTIVGTGALLPRSAQIAEIVRMSVAASMRRHGIGRRLLQHLMAHAKAQGYRRMILETLRPGMT